MKTLEYEDWSDSLEPGCGACHAPAEYCDCLRCPQCETLIDVQGAYEYGRLTPAVVCCSTVCLLEHAGEQVLRNCQEMISFQLPYHPVRARA